MNSDRNPLSQRKHILFCSWLVVATAGVAVSTWSGLAAWPPKQRPVAARWGSDANSRGAQAHRNGQTQFDLLARYLADDRRSRDLTALLRQADDPASPDRVGSHNHPLLDQPAPLFSLPDSNGQPWNLEARLAKGPVVLVFYLNYGCDACVSSLFELNSDVQVFQALGVDVAAISGDPAKVTERQFQRYGAFSFPVLCDAGHALAREYSVYFPADVNSPQRLLHGTFVIGQDRQVKWAHTGDAPFTNSAPLACELTQAQRAFSRQRQPGFDLTDREKR